jgi:hypothetical protein
LLRPAIAKLAPLGGNPALNLELARYFCAARADSTLAVGTNSPFASTRPLEFPLPSIRPELYE